MHVPQHPDRPHVPQSKVKEVVAFARERHAYDEWCERYPKAARELAEISQRYNATLESADKAVRAAGVTAGPWHVHQWRRTDDAGALCAAVGRERFCVLGGVIRQAEELAIDRVVLDAAIAQDKLDAAVVADVVTWAPALSGPKKILLP